MAINDLIELRTQLFANGYQPIPNFDKQTFLKGWNDPDYSKLGDIAKFPRRFKATGLRVTNNLRVIDLDIDHPLIDQVFSAIEEIVPDVCNRAPARYGASQYKVALFCRAPDGDEAFSMLPVHKYLVDGKAHSIELFGGGMARSGNVYKQMGAYGPHSHDPVTKKVAFQYAWDPERPSLLDTPLAELPELSKAQALEIAARFEAIATNAGWERVVRPAHDSAAAVYDITDLSRFDTDRAGGGLTYHELCDALAYHGELRCSASFMPDRGDSGDTSRCWVFHSPRHDCAAVFVYGDEQTHYPVSEKIDLQPIIDALAEEVPPPETLPGNVKLMDFYAFLPTHQYIYKYNGSLWPVATINSVLNKITIGQKPKKQTKKQIEAGETPEMVDVQIPAHLWLDRGRAVVQMTWAPGEPQIIQDRLLIEGGWTYQRGARGFNTYTPPTIVKAADPDIGRWRRHLERVYPDEAGEIEAWMAHRVQRPQEKINHSLVLGGRQGIGKDTLLEPLRYAVGGWNFNEVSPLQLLGRFNGFLKAVVLRVSEARDLGESDRYKFYNHTKTLMAAPPETMLIDEKNRQEYRIQNVCGVIITLNEKPSLYLPADDRRHFVAWSEQLTKNDFDADYFQEIYGWYQGGGLAAVAQYLAELNIAAFDAKRPPRLTPGFHDIVNMSRVAEDADMADALDGLGRPGAVTLEDVMQSKKCSNELLQYLNDRNNRRRIGFRFEECGYSAMRNRDAKDGLWVLEGRRQVIYVRSDLSTRERADYAQRRANRSTNIVAWPGSTPQN
jgi:hypothetical protein